MGLLKTLRGMADHAERRAKYSRRGPAKIEKYAYARGLGDALGTVEAWKGEKVE